MAHLTWKDAIEQVLRDSDEPLHANEIARRVLDAQLLTTKSATPGRNVQAIISQSLRDDDDASPFLQTGPCTFTVSGGAMGRGPGRAAADSVEQAQDEPDDELTGLIQAFGVSWRRDRIDWDVNPPRLMGEQAVGAKTVDFSEQIGLYLLYDQNRCVYAGRVTEPRLGRRLREHTRDRLNGRWDRFSWFGMRGVSDGGQLLPLSAQVSMGDVVRAMEALLIESLEPALNRRQGDAIGDGEFLQADDPSLAQRHRKAILEELLAKSV